MLERALADPARFGKDALLALAHLRRRGLSPSPEEACSVLELYLENPAIEPALAAEVLSSRTETVLSAFESARSRVQQLRGFSTAWRSARAAPFSPPPRPLRSSPPPLHSPSFLPMPRSESSSSSSARVRRWTSAP